MADMVEVRIGSPTADVLVVGKLEGQAPYAFWKRVVVDPSTVDTDKLVERLQASNTRWEGYQDVQGNYILLLPPVFKVNKIETVF